MTPFGHRLPSRMVAAAAAAVLAAAAAGCTQRRMAEPAPTPAVTTAPATPTVTPTPAQTETASEPGNAWNDPLRGAPPPELDIAGHEDPERLARSYREYRHWLYTNPDPDLSSDINHPECACHATDVRLLTYYQDEALWWTGGRSVITAVEVINDDAATVVVLRVTLRREEPSLLVDDGGGIHEELPTGEFVEDWIFVRENPGAPWLLRDGSEIERRDLTGGV
jgi:hypothetical protein